MWSDNHTVEFLPKVLPYRGESSLSRDRYEGGEDPRDAKNDHVFGRSQDGPHDVYVGVVVDLP